MRINIKRTLGAMGIAVGLGLVALFAYRDQVSDAKPAAADGRRSGPILIPGVQEPAEMRVEPMPVAVLTPPDRMLRDAMDQVANKKGGTAAFLAALDRILAKYPDYSDGYMMRLASLCEGGDRTAILSNVNSALKYISNSRTSKDSYPGLFSMRAKVEHANGHDSAAMEDLDKAIHATLADKATFVNSGRFASKEGASACTSLLSNSLEQPLSRVVIRRNTVGHCDPFWGGRGGRASKVDWELVKPIRRRQ